MDFAAHGYASYFVCALMDKHYVKGMSVEESLKLIQMCIDEVRRRFIVKPPTFIIKMIDKDGVRVLDSF